VDLTQPVSNPDPFPCGTRGHIAEGKRAGQVLRSRLELCSQFRGEAAFLGFDDRAPVMGDEAAQRRVGMENVPELARTVERMKAGLGEFGRVANDTLDVYAALGKGTSRRVWAISSAQSA
jgi:hypothetical protein